MDVESARRAKREVAALCHSGLDSRTLGLRAEQLVRSVIPFDFSCWHNVDPATAMLTSVIGEAPPTTPLLPLLEYGTVDVSQYAEVARSGAGAVALRSVTDDQPQESQRYREILAPMDVADELTCSFVGDHTFWGCARLYRTRRWPSFDSVEVAFMASLSSTLAEGFRAALLVPALKLTVGPNGPGVLVLDEQHRLESMTPAAERWLDEFVDVPLDETMPLPHAVFAVAAQALAISRQRPGAPLTARMLVPTRTGSWLALHGSTLQGGDDGRTVVMIEPAATAELAPIIVRAYGLTERERQVAGLVVRGQGNKQIAAQLGISPHTVSDFLKAVFEKMSVNSRTELAARLFTRHYYPRIEREDQPGPDGAF